MRKLLNGVGAILAICAILFAARYYLENSQGASGDTIVNFYNWGDYIDPSLLEEFEEETGYHVVYETFDSNEALISKIRQGGTPYDVTVPSDYMIKQMKEENLLLPLDYSLLPNAQNIDERFLDLEFDPKNEFSLPYFWGTLGFLYNTKEYSEEDFQTWDALWNPEFRNKILIYDGAREVMGIGLQSLGYSLNEKSDEALELATVKLKRMMPNIRAMVSDELKMYMAQEEAPVGITFSGEASQAIQKNPDLAYTVPKEGSNIWFDNIVIPKTARNLKGAHALIDFLMRPDIAARNAEYITYATPNKAAYPLLPKEVIEDEAFYPSDELIAKLEAYKGLGKAKLIQYNDDFLEVKIEPK